MCIDLCVEKKTKLETSHGFCRNRRMVLIKPRSKLIRSNMNWFSWYDKTVTIETKKIEESGRGNQIHFIDTQMSCYNHLLTSNHYGSYYLLDLQLTPFYFVIITIELVNKHTLEYYTFNPWTIYVLTKLPHITFFTSRINIKCRKSNHKFFS